MWTMRWTCVCTLVVLLWTAPELEAATIFVAAGGDLQQALNAAQPGDTILLQENAEFVGNFVLPAKTGDAWITLRSAAPDTVLPPAGVRIQPVARAAAGAPAVRRMRQRRAAHRRRARTTGTSATSSSRPNQDGLGDIIQLGDGSSAQNSLARSRTTSSSATSTCMAIRCVGQKRGIALNAANVTIADSYISDCKGIGQDTQAIGGWNGPGPYMIENNYLEAAGENVHVRRRRSRRSRTWSPTASPFRRNYFSRPMSWRDPILPTPQGLSAVRERPAARWRPGSTATAWSRADRSDRPRRRRPRRPPK